MPGVGGWGGEKLQNLRTVQEAFFKATAFPLWRTASKYPSELNKGQEGFHLLGNE